MASVSKRVDNETYLKAKNFLQQGGQPMGDNSYCYLLAETDGLPLDACICLNDNKITIKRIWVMELKQGIFSPRNTNGETGRHAKILGEKYLNRLLKSLETIDFDNIQYPQSLIYHDDIKRAESCIDQTIVDPNSIGEAEVKLYERAELIASALSALRWFCGELGETDYNVTYCKDNMAFKITLNTYKLSVDVTLANIVHRKWKTLVTLDVAAFFCANDLIQAAQVERMNY